MPKFTQADKDQLITALNAAIEAAMDMPVTKSCHTCANYDLRGGAPLCRAAGITPPPDVVEVGCEGYMYDPTSPPF